MAPKVLVSDKLSETAVQIFRDRGIDVDFMPGLGKDKDKLAEVIGQYDGLAIRSATKATAKLLERADNLKVIGRAGIDHAATLVDLRAAEFLCRLLLAERPSCLVARIPSCVVVIRESTFVPFTKRALSPSFPLAIESLWLCKK